MNPPPFSILLPTVNQCLCGFFGSKRPGSVGMVLCFVVFAFSTVALSQSYTPDHEVVKAMVNQGLKYLGGSKQSSGEAGGSRLGYELFIAYTFLKATDDHDHPRVNAQVPKAIKFAKQLSERSDAVLKSEKVMYEAAVAAMFLAAVDPQKYRESIEQIRDFLINSQNESGGFGYLHGPYSKSEGDVSQTQYIALSLWSLKQAKIDVDSRAVEKLTRWMLKVQQNDGGWSYQFPPHPQFPPTHSMLAAGLSGALVGADTIGILRGPGAGILMEGEEEEDALVPAAFRRVASEDKSASKGVKAISRQEIQRSVDAATRLLTRKPYQRGANDWYYYWMYSRERFESFIELLIGKRERSPDWYNRGVTELKKNQSSDGSWGTNDRDPSGPEASTCFAILFLLRNTQKTIGDLKSADSVGGYGLNNVAEVGFVDGKLVDKSQVTSIEDAIKLLESNQDGSTEDKLLADRMVLDADPKKRKEQLNRFARLLRSPDARARRVAAKLLGRGDDLDFVPDLIFALSEGEQDGQVLRLAENSLRILSRQLTTYILPPDGLITAADRVKAERYWQSWFLSIRPDYVFIDQ
jgi:Squalene-hopene cyclase C-terminal domain